MAIQHTAQINPSGGIPELEIQFGEANIGAYRIFRWDSASKPVEIGHAGKVSCGVPAASLAGKTVSYETLIQSAQTGARQSYALRVLVRQDGAIVPGGDIAESGNLNGDGAKSIIGFITFQHL